MPHDYSSLYPDHMGYVEAGQPQILLKWGAYLRLQSWLQSSPICFSTRQISIKSVSFSVLVRSGLTNCFCSPRRIISSRYSLQVYLEAFGLGFSMYRVILFANAHYFAASGEVSIQIVFSQLPVKPAYFKGSFPGGGQRHFLNELGFPKIDKSRASPALLLEKGTQRFIK